MNNTERFTGRAAQYVSQRPSYPAELIAFLKEALEWSNEVTIADIGAGTGKFTELLLRQGCSVIAVEPNDDMRLTMLEHLNQYVKITPEKYENVDGMNERKLLVKNTTGEQTNLPDQSVDGIVCAQSFHWLDIGLARAEFIRIIKPKGYVALVWNQRVEEASPFMRGYEQLLYKYAKGYEDAGHRKISQQYLTPFFGGKQPELRHFQLDQTLNQKQLVERIQSSSYGVLQNDPRYDQFIIDCHQLFNEHEQDGLVTMIYRTDLYWGTLT